MHEGSDLPEDLSVMGEAPELNGAAFNPIRLIRVVNTLRRFGKKAALEMLRKYVEAVTEEIDKQRVFLVARVLFVPSDGSAKFPPLLLGDPVPFPPANVGREPLFPLVMVRDMPFLAVIGYGWMLGGLPQSPLDHLEFCGKHCMMRSCDLEPDASAVDAIETDARFKGSDWALYLSLLRRQALRAMAPSYVVSEEDADALDSQWPQHVHRVAKLQPQWSARMQEFIATAHA